MSYLSSVAPLLNIDAGLATLLIGIFTRVSFMAILAPGLGERFVPIGARLAAAFAIAALAASALSDMDSLPIPNSPIELATILFIEAFAGALLGLSARVFIFVLQTAGGIIAQHLSLSQLFGSAVSFEADSPFSAILTFSGVCIAVIMGAHLQLVAAIIQSYQILPFGEVIETAAAADWVLDRSGFVLKFALQLSAPFVLLGVIYVLALAAASRAMTQLSAAFVGAPAIILTGMLLFAIAAPLALKLWLNAYASAASALLGVTP